MDVDLFGPSLPPHLGGKQSIQDSDPRHHLEDQLSMHESDLRHVSDEHSGQSEEPSRVVSARPKTHADKRKHKVRSRYPSSSSGEDQSPVHKHKSSKPSRALSDHDQPQHDPDPLFYREVAMADLPSQFAEEVETFRRILNLPDSRKTMPRSSTSVLGLDDQKGQQELLLCPHLVLTSKMLLISVNMTFWPLTYLRVNILNPLPPLQDGTRWDSLVMKTKSRSCTQTFRRSVSLLIPLELLWVRFPFQFLRSWNIKLGRTSPPLTSWLLLPRLRLPVIPL